MHYRVRSTKVKCLRWFQSRAQAIAAFESKCKRVGIVPPECCPARAAIPSPPTSLLIRVVPVVLACVRATAGCLSVPATICCRDERPISERRSGIHWPRATTALCDVDYLEATACGKAMAQRGHAVRPQRRPSAAFFIVCGSARGHVSSIMSKCDGFHIPITSVAETVASLPGGGNMPPQDQGGGPGWAVSQTQPTSGGAPPEIRAAAD